MFHITSLSPLYEAVQTSDLFPDSKYFPDCIPLQAPERIREAYIQEHTQAGFDLKTFVERHFAPPETPEESIVSEAGSLTEHLNHLWDLLLRKADSAAAASSLIPLPHPYIVPGGRFREVYYWDSYFTMLGLKVSGRMDIVRHMADNFAWLIDTAGHVPNGNRTYYLSRSQPPFFALIAGLLAETEGPSALVRYLPQMQKEHAYWQQEGKSNLAMPDGGRLNRYWDELDTPRPEAYIEDYYTAAAAKLPAPEVYRHLRAAAASGWDFSSRWFDNPKELSSIRCADFIPVDLNCLLFHLENTIANALEHQGNPDAADTYRQLAVQRQKWLLHYCWDEANGFFFDYDWRKKQRSIHWTLAAVFPLFFNMVQPAQAGQVANVIAEKFLKPGGLVTTLKYTGQQWDAPNGWAPLQWMAYRGLRQYGHFDLAATAGRHWLHTCENTWKNTGKMMEKYNVETPDMPGGGGEYPNQDGFGWTNGVYLAIRSEMATSVSQ